jgi:aspartyl-tRNA synthetase
METLSKSFLSHIEKEKIIKVIDANVESIFQGWNEMNVDKAFVQNFANSADFNFIGIDGVILNYDQMIKTVKEHFELYDSFVLSVKEKKFNVLSADIVIVSLTYGGYVIMKNNRINFQNVGSTLVYQKLEDKWLVIQFQESTQLSETAGK